MNNALQKLQPYPFEKLRALLGAVQPAADKRAIALSIGEPKHERFSSLEGKRLNEV